MFLILNKKKQHNKTLHVLMADTSQNARSAGDDVDYPSSISLIYLFKDAISLLPGCLFDTPEPK